MTISGDLSLLSADEMSRDHALLQEAWRQPSGIWGWLMSVDHKAIARRYFVTTFLMFLAGGIEALFMRLQLARPENAFIGPDRYNQLFSMHGTTMMFLFAVPVMTAVGLYFVPLMIGARNVAFPRLNAFGYWTYLIGVLFLYVSFAFNMGPDAGWTSYVPLSGPAYSPGHRIDVWAQVVTFTEISGLVAAVNIIVTIFKMRAPGMSLDRMPIFVWAELVVAFMIVFALPAVALGSTLLLAADRAVSTQFFNPAEGGDAVLWQHVFWFFGHPEVYIIFLPGVGMITPVVEAFARRRLFGYTAVVAANIATAFFAFGLWVHHMFAAPVPETGASLFTAASILIAIPTGLQVFCWIATLWEGRLVLATPLLFVLGFLFTFVNGGVTGVMLASVSFDQQVHDSFFVVAHLHYVLLGGAIMPLLGAIYYWFPKVTGRVLGETLGKWHFWLFLIGVNVTFFPMHVLGLNGMPRRMYTYYENSGWAPLNLLATIGAFVIALSIAIFIVNVVRTLRKAPTAGDNPWNAAGLEWAMPSPPPAYNFLYPIAVRHRHPLWDSDGELSVLMGLRTDRRETLLTTVFTATPDSRHSDAIPSIWPLFVAICMGIAFIGAIFYPVAVPIGLLLSVAPLVGWAWTGSKPTEEDDIDSGVRRARLRGV